MLGGALTTLDAHAPYTRHRAEIRISGGGLKTKKTPCDQEVFLSGWGDLNSRPSVPQTDALTKLRHSPFGKAARLSDRLQPQRTDRRILSRIGVIDWRVFASEIGLEERL